MNCFKKVAFCILPKMQIENFSDYYKTIGNEDLLSSLGSPSGCQPLAVEAAKSELKNQQLSDFQIQEAKEMLIFEICTK